MAISFAVTLLFFAAIPFILTLLKNSTTDSPWFWGYLFGMFALVALSFAGPKFRARQRQLEEQFHGRQTAVLTQSGQEVDVDLSPPDNTIVTLWPLYAGLSAATVIAWVVYWWTSRKSPRPISSSPSNL